MCKNCGLDALVYLGKQMYFGRDRVLVKKEKEKGNICVLES